MRTSISVETELEVSVRMGINGTYIAEALNWRGERGELLQGTGESPVAALSRLRQRVREICDSQLEWRQMRGITKTNLTPVSAR